MSSTSMTVIRGRQLTTFDMSPDGESFAIHVTDEQARPASLVLPAECLNALMMTRPEMHGDPERLRERGGERDHLQLIRRRYSRSGTRDGA